MTEKEKLLAWARDEATKRAAADARQAAADVRQAKAKRYRKIAGGTMIVAAVGVPLAWWASQGFWQPSAGVALGVFLAIGLCLLTEDM